MASEDPKQFSKINNYLDLYLFNFGFRHPGCILYYENQHRYFLKVKTTSPAATPDDEKNFKHKVSGYEGRGSSEF